QVPLVSNRGSARGLFPAAHALERRPHGRVEHVPEQPPARRRRRLRALPPRWATCRRTASDETTVTSRSAWWPYASRSITASAVSRPECVTRVRPIER